VIAESKRALELDPLSLIINAGWGPRLYRAHSDGEAISSLNQALELDPYFFPNALEFIRAWETKTRCVPRRKKQSSTMIAGSIF